MLRQLDRLIFGPVLTRDSSFYGGAGLDLPDNHNPMTIFGEAFSLGDDDGVILSAAHCLDLTGNVDDHLSFEDLASHLGADTHLFNGEES